MSMFSSVRKFVRFILMSWMPLKFCSKSSFVLSMGIFFDMFRSDPAVAITVYFAPPPPPPLWPSSPFPP